MPSELYGLRRPNRLGKLSGRMSGAGKPRRLSISFG